MAKHFAAAGACIAVLLAGLCVFLWYTSATSLQLLGPRSESPHPSGCALCTLSCVGLQPGCLCIMVRSMVRCMFCNYTAAVGHFPSTAAELLCQGFHSFGGQAQQGIHTPACRLLCCPVAPATAAFVCPGSHVKPPCLCAVSVCFPLWSTPGLLQQQGWLRLHSVID